MNFNFRQTWKDARLGVNEANLTGGAELLAKIWKPDTFFPVALNVVGHSLPNPNVYVKITSQGSVSISQRLTARVFCMSDNLKFPTNCGYKIESYGFSTEDITYNWKTNGFFVDEETVYGKDSRVYIIPYQTWRTREYTSQRSSGNHSALAAEFDLYKLSVE